MLNFGVSPWLLEAWYVAPALAGVVLSAASLGVAFVLSGVVRQHGKHLESGKAGRKIDFADVAEFRGTGFWLIAVDIALYYGVFFTLIAFANAYLVDNAGLNLDADVAARYVGTPYALSMALSVVVGYCVDLVGYKISILVASNALLVPALLLLHVQQFPGVAFVLLGLCLYPPSGVVVVALC